MTEVEKMAYKLKTKNTTSFLNKVSIFMAIVGVGNGIVSIIFSLFTPANDRRLQDLGINTVLLLGAIFFQLIIMNMNATVKEIE
jgi:hypothetical protein